MFRLSLFLAISVSLHLMAGSSLLWPEASGADATRSRPAVQVPAVVQVLLAPAPTQSQPKSKPVALSAPRKPAQPVFARLPAKPAAQPARAVTKATSAKTVSKASAQPSAMAAVAQPASAVATPHPPVTASVEVFSRQPAFRLPPQQPRYPAQARRRNQQGVVLLEVRLDERGKQREISLVRSSGFPSLDQAALEAVKDWRFHPETLNGQGVPSRVQIPIEFALLASR